MAGSEYLVNSPPGGIFTLLKGHVSHQVFWLTPLNQSQQPTAKYALLDPKLSEIEVVFPLTEK